MRGKRAKQLRRIARNVELKEAELLGMTPAEYDEKVKHGRVSLYRKLKRNYHDTQ